MHESIAGADRTTTLLVSGAPGTVFESPGPLPVIVCWVGGVFGGEGPDRADLVVARKEVVDLTTLVERNPLAATTLAVLLRSSAESTVAAALAHESAAYSMLQAGPEFEAWRATAPRTPHAESQAPVVVERDGDKLTITLDRPQRHNAITTRMRDELCEALAIAVADDSIGEVLLRGNGPSFCSGGDLNEFGTRADPATAHITRLAQSPARLLHLLRDRVTAEIHGATLGGGIEMAAFAHRVVARGDTTIGLPELGLGLIPGAGGTVSIPRRIGRQRTAALALTNLRIDAETAKSWGLVDELVD